MSATPPCSPHTRRNRENLSPKHLTGHEDRSAIVEQRQRLLNCKQRAAHVQAEGRIEVLFGNFAQWYGFARAGARVQDVDLALYPLDCIEQAVEVVEIGNVAAHSSHVPANQLDGLIERLLPPARDENVGAPSTNSLALASAMPLDPPVMTSTLP